MNNKLSDLLDQLAEELPENETVKAAQDEYASMYAEEEGEELGVDEMSMDSDAPAEDEVGAMGFDDLMAEDSADAPAESEDAGLDAIFGKAKPKDKKKAPAKGNPFADM